MSVTSTTSSYREDGRPPPTVLIIDGHPLFSTAMRMALRAEGVDAHQLSVRDLDTILSTASLFPPAVVLLEVALRGDAVAQPIDVATLIAALHRQGKQVLLLSGIIDEPGTAAAIAAGAIGALHKSMSFESLLRTLTQAAAGIPVMAEDERHRWLVRHRQYQDQQRRFDHCIRRLTPRELEVLRSLAEGHCAADIAAQSMVSITTVRSQIHRTLTKLGVNSQLEAVALLDNPYHTGTRTRPT
jgi:DNA-binding NarL/FixJ family response regulator